MIADGDDCPNCYNPIANAGFDETYYRGDIGNLTTVCLDGSNSFRFIRVARLFLVSHLSAARAALQPLAAY